MVATTPAPSRCWCLVSRWHEAQYRKIWGHAGLIRVSSEALNPRPPVALIVQRVPADVESERYQLWYLSAHSVSLATSPRIPEGSRKKSAWPMRAAAAEESGSISGCQTTAPKTPVLRVLWWETREAGRASCVLQASIGRARGAFVVPELFGRNSAARAQRAPNYV